MFGKGTPPSKGQMYGHALYLCAFWGDEFVVEMAKHLRL